jgi:hypothetical protein
VQIAATRHSPDATGNGELGARAVSTPELVCFAATLGLTDAPATVRSSLAGPRTRDIDRAFMLGARGDCAPGTQRQRREAGVEHDREAVAISCTDVRRAALQALWRQLRRLGDQQKDTAAYGELVIAIRSEADAIRTELSRCSRTDAAAPAHRQGRARALGLAGGASGVTSSRAQMSGFDARR